MPPEPAFLPLCLAAPAMPRPQWSFRSLQGTLLLEPEGQSFARPEQRPESGHPRPSPEPSTHRASPRLPSEARVQGSVSSFSRVSVSALGAECGVRAGPLSLLGLPLLEGDNALWISSHQRTGTDVGLCETEAA